MDITNHAYNEAKLTIPATSLQAWVKFKLDQLAKVFYSDLFLSCLSLNNYN